MKKLKNIISKNNKNRKGITLVALVVTIVVLLILAGITITALFGENGIISQAQKAKTETERDQGDTQNGLANLTDQMNDILGLGGIDAKAIANEENKSQYYGKTVDYTVSDETIQTALTNSSITWKIFYADESNIYLIASDYVPLSTLPKPINADNTKGTAPANTVSSCPLAAPLTNVLSSYSTGSARIADPKIQALNSKYHKYLNDNSTSSTNNNMKAVAYILDTKAWEGYKDSTEKADFVIGGPTVKMLMKSYNGYKNLTGSNEYQTRVISVAGYEISKDGGANWATYYSGMLDTSNSLYVSRTSNTDSMWLSSPAASNSDSVMLADYRGFVTSGKCNVSCFGFRPLVCLKSDIRLKPVYDTDGTTIVSFEIK